jgi:micrococcal nuclease
MPRRRHFAVTALVVLAIMASGCRGIASSRTEVTPPPNVASSARVTGSGVPQVIIDRECSKLADETDEYVCLTNQDPNPADMGAWVLRNVLGRTYNFPPGFILQPGQTVKVHTGAGTDTPTDLHWGYRVNPAWDNSDKLTLHNNEDVEVFVSEPKP